MNYSFKIIQFKKKQHIFIYIFKNLLINCQGAVKQYNLGTWKFISTEKNQPRKNVYCFNMYRINNNIISNFIIKQNLCSLIFSKKIITKNNFCFISLKFYAESST